MTGSSVSRVNFHSLQQQISAPEWVTLIDMEDSEELSDTEKMVLLDCTKAPLLNSLASLSNDALVVAVLCVCREVTEQELKISPEELNSGEYPFILFLQDKATDVAELKQLLLLNPQEVECSISQEQTLSPMLQETASKESSESTFDTGKEYSLCVFICLLKYLTIVEAGYKNIVGSRKHVLITGFYCM